MAVEVLDDVILTGRQIEGGVRGKQLRRNSRVEVDNGAEFINIVWSQTLREFELGFVPMRREAWQDIETLHEITEGGAYGFLLEDPKDATVTTAQGVVTSLGGGTYQLYKRYTHAASSRTKDRKITRPKSGAVTVYVSGTPTAAVIDSTDGTLTITGSPSAALVTWAGSFYVPVHFMIDSIDWDMVAPSQDPDARFLAGPSVILQEIRE